jgi:hypothetical protein
VYAEEKIPPIYTWFFAEKLKLLVVGVAAYVHDVSPVSAVPALVGITGTNPDLEMAAVVTAVVRP